jgi:enoyl-CoA hydratase/carnithine racemase/methionyl-tRNA formyltransferase
MKILFLCTAHNSLSQRLYLTLSDHHDVTIEYALSPEVMISAAELAHPDMIICPFLTTRVPKEVYDRWLTLVVHPGPPGDAGPSALDWVLMGDDGSVENVNDLLKVLDQTPCAPGRTHWGVTVLQAIEAFDAGPIWAFEQFPINIDQPGLTKSELYRGPVTRAAVKAVSAALSRITAANTIHRETINPIVDHESPFPSSLKAHMDYRHSSVGTRLPFQGGKTFSRPLLKAIQRDFDISRHTAQQISRRIRCGDSQPGVQSRVFGPSLYIYGGIIEEAPAGVVTNVDLDAAPGTIVATRDEAVCISTCDGRGVWITHIRRPKKAADKALWPKVPAISGLRELGIIDDKMVGKLRCSATIDWSRACHGTFQEVWIDFVNHEDTYQTAYLYFNFYNGAMSTSQCSHLLKAMDYILSYSTPNSPVRAVVLMGGAYFSNGIHLNIIEASSSPSLESWNNINRIDDVVKYLLSNFPSQSIITVAAIRGNAAAGGVALAAACDIVIAGSEVVLNPAYRAIGLYGSEYHTISYFGRCGEASAKEMLHSMTPMSAFTARSTGLVDHVLMGTGLVLDDQIRRHVFVLTKSMRAGRGFFWRQKVDLSPSSLAAIRAAELAEMALDFFSPRAIRFHKRRFDFVRKIKPTSTPMRFAKHRRFDTTSCDDEEKDDFDSVVHYELLNYQQLLAKYQQERAQAVPSPVLEPVVQQQVIESSSTKSGIVFSCYYKTEEPISPPKTP